MERKKKQSIILQLHPHNIIAITFIDLTLNFAQTSKHGAGTKVSPIWFDRAKLGRRIRYMGMLGPFIGRNKTSPSQTKGMCGLESYGPRFICLRRPTLLIFIFSPWSKKTEWRRRCNRRFFDFFFLEVNSSGDVGNSEILSFRFGFSFFVAWVFSSVVPPALYRKKNRYLMETCVFDLATDGTDRIDQFAYCCAEQVEQDADLEVLLWLSALLGVSWEESLGLKVGRTHLSLP